MESSWNFKDKKEIFSSPYLTLEQWDIVTPQGKEMQPLLAKEHDAVIVFPITEEGKVVTIHQYFISHQRPFVTLVVGIVAEGEDRAKTAERELMEEAGYEAEEMIYVGAAHRGKWTTGTMHFYIAKNAVKTQPQQLEAEEEIEVRELSVEHVKQLLRSGELQDMGVFGCAYRALDYLGLLSDI